jgi:hypothetical protein
MAHKVKDVDRYTDIQWLADGSSKSFSPPRPNSLLSFGPILSPTPVDQGFYPGVYVVCLPPSILEPHMPFFAQPYITEADHTCSDGGATVANGVIKADSTPISAESMSLALVCS